MMEREEKNETFCEGGGQSFIPQSSGTRLPPKLVITAVLASPLEEDGHCGYRKTAAQMEGSVRTCLKCNMCFPPLTVDQLVG